MPAIPGKNHLQVVGALEKIGYSIIRQSRHTIMSNGTIRLEIPRHNPINCFTMYGIAREAGLTREQFEELY